MHGPNRGLFISFEGGEGAGKTTLIASLKVKLSQTSHREVVVTREPGGTPLGLQIRQLLLHRADVQIGHTSELFLFLADRAQHVEEIIRPALAKGAIVLCDRFTDSTIAYQGVGRAIDAHFLQTVTHFAAHALEPRMTFYLDIDPKEGLLRIKKASSTREGASNDRLEKEKLDFHEAVRKGFLGLAALHSERIIKIDAMLSKEEVCQIAWKHIEKHLQSSF